MSVITQTWATIPNYPNYEILYDRSKGEKIRRKKELRGRRMGVKSSGFIGGRAVVVTVDGWVTLKKGPHTSQERQKAAEVYDHTFYGKILLTPSERKEARMAEAKAARESKLAHDEMIRQLAEDQ